MTIKSAIQALACDQISPIRWLIDKAVECPHLAGCIHWQGPIPPKMWKRIEKHLTMMDAEVAYHELPARDYEWHSTIDHRLVFTLTIYRTRTRPDLVFTAELTGGEHAEE